MTLLCLPVLAQAYTNLPWHLAGTAAANQAGVVVLTQAVGGQNGAAWNECQINITQAFDLTFAMNFGTNTCGADGMAFVLQNDSQGVGGNAGAHAADGFAHSVAIEFDTYSNVVAPYSDPPYDSLGIQTGGNIQVAGPVSCGGLGVVTGPTACGRPAISSSQFNIKDGLFHTVRLTWDPSTYDYKIYVDGDPTPRAWWTLPSTYVSTIFNNNPMVYFGFTAATGGSYNYHQIAFVSGTVNGGTNATALSCAPTPTNTPVNSPTAVVVPTNFCGTPTNMPSFTYSPTPAPPTPTFSNSPTPYPPGCGPPAAVAHTNIANGCNPGTTAFNNPGGANTLLVVRVEKGSSGGTPTGISYNGIALSLARTDPGASGGSFISTWYLVAPPTGSNNIVFSGTTGCSYNIVAEVYSGVDQTTPIGNISAGTGTAVVIVPSVSYSITANYNAAIAASIITNYIAMPQVPSVSYGAGQTSYNYQAADGCCDEVTGDYKTVLASGAGTMTYTLDQQKAYGYQTVEIRGYTTCGTPSNTPSATPSVTPSNTRSATPTASPTRTATPSFTPSATPSATRTVTQTATPTVSRTATPTLTASPSPTPTRTESNTPGPSPTPTDSPTATPSRTITLTMTPSATPSFTQTATATRTDSATPTPSVTITTPYTATNTPTATPTLTPSPSFTESFSFTASPSFTATPSPTTSFTGTPTLTATPSATPTATVTESFTATQTRTASPTPTPSATVTASFTATPSFTDTATPTPTPSVTFTFSVSPTHTQSPLPSPNQVRITVYNSAGEVVQQLFEGSAERVPTELLTSAGVLVNSDPAGLNIQFPGALSRNGATQYGLVWLLRNDSGQRVGGGIYYIKAEFKDPFGTVSSFTKSVQILEDATGDSVRIYNPAGELVWAQDLSVSAASLVIPDGGSYVAEFDALGASVTGGLGLAVKDGAGVVHTLSFDGRNQNGAPLASGSYLVQVEHRGPAGAHLVMAKSISLLRAESLHPLATALIGPNPATGQQPVRLHYAAAALRTCVADIYSLSGELVARGEDRTQSGVVVLALQDRASGVYVVRVRLYQSGRLHDQRVMKLALAH